MRGNVEGCTTQRLFTSVSTATELRLLWLPPPSWTPGVLDILFQTIMSLPERTTVLIIGAGPSGLSTAVSLVHHGFRDLVIVEEKSSRGEASRAMTIHASTLEVLYCCVACLYDGTLNYL
jgi:hypothetical protein